MSSLQVKLDDQILQVEIAQLSDEMVRVQVNGVPVNVRVPPSGANAAPEWLVIGDRPYEVILDREHASLRWQDQIHHVQVHDLDGSDGHVPSADGRVKAPIPGVVTRILVEQGQPVEMGQTLLILEAMKMENQIRAPRAGVVSNLNTMVGRGVMLGELLAEIK